MRRLALVPLLLTIALTPTGAATPTPCLRASGNAGARCLREYTNAIERCRVRQDAACETAARARGGPLAEILARPDVPSRRACTEDAAVALGYLDVDDVVVRTVEACTDFAEDLLKIGWPTGPVSGNALACQRTVAERLRRLRALVVREFGPGCYLRAFAGGVCPRGRRDARIAHERAGAHRRILAACGTGFDALGLAMGPTLEARVDDLLGRVATRSRHYAAHVFPPNDLGPAARFGPFKVGVRTLPLVDPSRMNTTGTGPRPVTTEVYYPSTAAAVAGVPRDIVRVLGVDVVATPAYRDVARAAGTFPLVLFSHGNGGIRFQSFFFAAHLASHGFVVVTPDHHGNTFVDALLGIVDPNVATNRPLDMSFLIDRMLDFTADPASFFAGAIDPDRIGMSGHSFGGFTTWALAGGPFALGTFTDPRIKAIFPQAPASPFSPAFFQTITIPTLVVGGSLDTTTPFGPNQRVPFDHLPPGAPVVALAELTDAGHFTFSDFCEAPRALLGFLGGFSEACEPRHLPWRYAHDIVNYLSLNFFDGILNGNAAALAQLPPAPLAPVADDDLVWQAK